MLWLTSWLLLVGIHVYLNNFNIKALWQYSREQSTAITDGFSSLSLETFLNSFCGYKSGGTSLHFIMFHIYSNVSAKECT